MTIATPPSRFINSLQSYLRVLPDRTPRELFNYSKRKAQKTRELTQFDAEHPCVFVLSTGRTGTQTLAALAALSSNVFAYHEPTPKLFGISKLAYEHQGNEFAQQVMTEAFLAMRKDHFRYALRCDRGYVETGPDSTFLAPSIASAVPGVKFIHLVRNPQAVVTSGMRRGWYAGNSSDRTRIVPHPGTEQAERWHEYTAFEKNCWLWNETNRWIMTFLDTLPPERKLLLHAEELFSNSAESVERFYRFLGTNPPESRKISSVLGKQLNAQRTSSFSSSADWRNDSSANLWAWVGATATSLGYENLPERQNLS